MLDLQPQQPSAHRGSHLWNPSRSEAFHGMGQWIGSKGRGGTFKRVCFGPTTSLERQVNGEPLQVNAEAGLRPTTGSEVPPVADHEHMLRDRSVFMSAPSHAVNV